MADDAAIQQFTAVTGAPESTARFFLESSGGQVETAINAYLEGGQPAELAEQDGEPLTAHPPPTTAAPSAPARGAQATASGVASGPRWPPSGVTFDRPQAA